MNLLKQLWFLWNPSSSAWKWHLPNTMKKPNSWYSDTKKPNNEYQELTNLWVVDTNKLSFANRILVQLKNKDNIDELIAYRKKYVELILEWKHQEAIYFCDKIRDILQEWYGYIEFWVKKQYATNKIIRFR